MLSRVAAVKAPRTHNRRRVTGSSGRRREGGESEPQSPNMSRRVFTSAVLLLLVVMMFCGTGGAAKAEDDRSSDPKFKWTRITDDKEAVESLGVPGLLKVGSDVFAVAEAQCKKGENSFTGIASKLLTNTVGKEPEEVLKEAKKDTQILEEVGSEDPKKRVDVSRPTAVVDESNIYMLVGKHSHEAADTCQAETEKIKSGVLLVKGEVSGEAENKQILWKETGGVPCTLGDQHKTLKRMTGGGGSGVKMEDGTLVFPVEATKKNEAAGMDGKTVSLILYFSKEVTNWTLSKGMSADGCGDPSVVEWKEKLMMMTACDDGPRRVYESGDEEDSWTEALGTLSRVWGNKQGNEKGVGSGFITAKLDNRDVMLVTLPVYAKTESEENGKEKGELHLWLTDNTHIVDIGSVSGKDEDVAASSLLYKSGTNGNKKDNELIALYEKKGDADTPSLGMVSVRLAEQLKRVMDVLTTWKEVDKRVYKLCHSEGALKDVLSGDACSADKITAGLVGFLSGNFSGNTWRDEYLGVNATVNKKEGEVTSTENGVKFTGRGAGAEWPVGSQGENQLYHFANYNFTLVATVSFEGEPKEGNIPVMGVKMNDGDKKTVLVGLSYNNKEKKWILLCDGGENKEHSSHWEPDTAHQVAIVLQNEKEGSVYVDGILLGNAQLDLQDIEGSKGISHFYIGGDGGSAGTKEDVPVTVENVLLYNRPLTSEEIDALNPNKAPISPPEDLTAAVLVDTSSTVVSGPVAQKTVSVSTPGESTVNHESSASSGENEGTVGGTDGQKEEGIQLQNREVNATALNSSLVNSSQGNNSDGGIVRGSGLLPSLLLLLGLWVFAAL
ncbi:trans-sialidase [Trypanosoma cruzi Dm28c]|uniref:Trans-sialidase n=2 Tax=Trypanosoma cruzi TaxID=5693 RepID=V5B5S4_TRYCR|nr:trans-sialidase [Trypanosoma cruzi Dm28c]PBJ68539.1 trans-sialidase [Trypanosoma cruzi cruzi]PWU86438.1 putative trans-sialidase, Group V [Trypanosoma cruzi]